MRKQQLNYAVGFYGFAISLDALITILKGNRNTEYNKAITYLAQTLNFKLAVILWSIVCFTVFTVLSYLMFRYNLATTAFVMLIVLSIFHLQGALTWICDIVDLFRIPALITLIMFTIYDLRVIKQNDRLAQSKY